MDRGRKRLFERAHRTAGLLCTGLVLCAGLAGAPCSGQTPPPGTKTFTLDQAVDYALAHYPAVRAALSGVTAAQAGVGVAETAYLPSANTLWQTNRGTRNNIFGQLLPQSVIPSMSGPVLGFTSGANVWSSAGGMLVAWEPLDFGYRKASVAEARTGESQASAQLRITRLDVALATVERYFALLQAEQVARAARADVERRETFAKSVGVLVENQLRPGADASRAAADLAQAQIRSIRAATAESASREALANLLGLGDIRIEAAPGPLLGPPQGAALSAASPAENPFAIAQQFRIEAAQARDRALAKSYAPKFNLQAALYGRGSGAETDGTTLGGANGLGLQRMNWDAGVQVTFPVLQIFAIREQRKVEQANAQAERARYDQELQDLSGEIAQARINLEGQQQIARTTPTEVSSARDTEQQARARYEAGLATIVEVSEAQNILSQAEVDDAIARLGVWHGLAGVAAAQGDLQPFLDLVRSAGH